MSHNDLSIQDAAFDWLAEMNSGERLSEDRRAAFQAWLNADVGHAAAFTEAQTLWGDLAWAETLNEAVLDQDQATIPLSPDLARRSRSVRVAPVKRRRIAMGTAIAAGLAAALLLAPGAYHMAMEHLQVQTQETATEAGEIRHITLTDGSRVTLGGRSSLRIRMSRDRREVEVMGGDAYFEVAHDPMRPFIVRNGGMDATAVGTAFEVNHGAHILQVSVTEGRVRAVASADTVVLGRGERAQLASDGSLLVGRFDPDTVGRWREQRAVFRDAPLAQVVETLNRYHPSGVVLADPSLADLPVSAVFGFDQMEVALNAMAGSQGLDIGHDDKGRLVIGRAR